MKSQDPKNHQSPQEVGGLPEYKIFCKYCVNCKAKNTASGCCFHCKAMESARDYIRILEAEIDHFKATKDDDKEIMDLLNAALDHFDDYIGLANVVESFIAITPEHLLYDSIRKDIICYLKNIKKKK